MRVRLGLGLRLRLRVGVGLGVGVGLAVGVGVGVGVGLALTLTLTLTSARFGALDRKMGAYQAALEHVRSAVLQAPRPAEQAPPSPRERRSSFLGGLFEGD